MRGEEIRSELTDGEAGVNMRFAIQVVDVNTCDPVPDAWVDLWSCNSTVCSHRPNHLYLPPQHI